jgi:hypothetical protein
MPLGSSVCPEWAPGKGLNGRLRKASSHLECLDTLVLSRQFFLPRSGRKDQVARYLSRANFSNLCNIPLFFIKTSTSALSTLQSHQSSKMNLFRKKEAETAVTDTAPELNEDPLATVPKNKWGKIWPVLACGSGLFAEGYVQSVCPNLVSCYAKAHVRRLLAPLEQCWA